MPLLQTWSVWTDTPLPNQGAKQQAISGIEAHCSGTLSVAIPVREGEINPGLARMKRHLCQPCHLCAYRTQHGQPHGARPGKASQLHVNCMLCRAVPRCLWPVAAVGSTYCLPAPPACLLARLPKPVKILPAATGTQLFTDLPVGFNAVNGLYGTIINK